MKKSSDKPSLKGSLLVLGGLELYVVVLIAVAAFVIELTSSALGRSALDPSIFPYLAALGAIVIGLDMTLFFSKRWSPVSYLFLVPPVVVYAIFCKVSDWGKWFSLVSNEIDEALHIMTRFSLLRSA